MDGFIFHFFIDWSWWCWWWLNTQQEPNILFLGEKNWDPYVWVYYSLLLFWFFFCFCNLKCNEKKHFHMCQVLLRKMDIHAFLHDDSLFTFIFFFGILKSDEKWKKILCLHLFQVVPYSHHSLLWADGWMEWRQKKRKKKFRKFLKKKYQVFFRFQNFHAFYMQIFPKLYRIITKFFFSVNKQINKKKWKISTFKISISIHLSIYQSINRWWMNKFHCHYSCGNNHNNKINCFHMWHIYICVVI